MEEIICGVFNGQGMVAEDGRVWPVPPNYASKSKLLEGDELKLRIREGDSPYLYKQLSRCPSKRLRAHVYWRERECWVQTNSREYRVLYQTATYFRLKDGEEVIILVPEDERAQWAAVEDVIRTINQDI